MHKQNVPLNLSKQVLKTNCEKVCLDGRDEQNNAFIDKLTTVKPLITNTSEEFIKCRLDNFPMSFILYYVTFSNCENK